MPLVAGTELGHYQIRSKLGEGGMGEVYLALDEKLGRKVALKILPAERASNQDRMRRFTQEAKAASALNHPNILTVFEIDESESGHFIATEFIDGETLRQRITGAPLKLAEVLDLAVQIASAVSAAHAEGIVHRDIKPDNVMVRQDGIVKVLDFGLAKLNETTDPSEVDTEAMTKALVHTQPGVLLGTVAYMSPEQARGLVVDPRTDIFSLGLVIYEMVAGQPPFSGATSADLIVALLEKEPPDLARFMPEPPAELQRLVMKALAKDRDERYQTAKDLLIDLKRFRQKLLVDAEIERAAPLKDQFAGRSTAARTSANAAIEKVNPTTGIARPTSRPEYLLSRIKHHKAAIAIIFTALVVAFAGLGYAVYQFGIRMGPVTSSPVMKMTRLISTGNAFDASISPDGKHIVYGLEEAGRQSIWLRKVATPGNVQIVPPSDASYSNFSFTSDGDYLFFNKTEPNGANSLYRMSSLGGGARKIAENVSSRVTLSSDGKQIAFIRGDARPIENSLVIAEPDGRGERVLATRLRPDNFAGELSWTPNGKSIVCVVGNHAEKLIEMLLDGSGEKPVKTPNWYAISGIEWLPDGTGLIVTVLEQARASPSQIWFLSYPSGEARKITNEFSNYFNPSLTADGRSLVVIRRETTSHIWVAPDGDASRAKQLTTGTSRQDGSLGISWTPDGRIVYDSTASGGRHIWIMNADGSDQRQLTDGDYDNQGARASPDGRSIVFTSNRTGAFHIYRMDMDGNNLKQVTNGPSEIAPFFSPDGRWVICNWTTRSWKVAADGGELTPLSNDSWASDISPDGKLVACVRLAGAGATLWKISILPFESGSPLTTLDVTSQSRPSLRWTPDGRAIIYNLTYGGVLSGVTNLWIQSLDGASAKQLTNFSSDIFFSFGTSRDGKWLAFGRGTTSSDVVLISNFR